MGHDETDFYTSWEAIMTFLSIVSETKILTVKKTLNGGSFICLIFRRNEFLRHEKIF